jgi:hypothetical protein
MENSLPREGAQNVTYFINGYNFELVNIYALNLS